MKAIAVALAVVLTIAGGTVKAYTTPASGLYSWRNDQQTSIDADVHKRVRLRFIHVYLGVLAVGATARATLYFGLGQGQDTWEWGAVGHAAGLFPTSYDIPFGADGPVVDLARVNLANSTAGVTEIHILADEVP